MMRLVTTITEIKSFLRQVHADGKSVALVPTMGSLHDGHLSLVRQAKRQCDVVVVSIFVNPTQFGPAEDFNRYPRNLEADVALLQPFMVDAVFAPSSSEMYPDGFESFVEPGETASTLEGALRPGHFRGATTVVLKLFNIIRPEAAYFGQKDFQQALVVRRMVEDLNLNVRLVVSPIVREADGVAKSSRNTLLSADDRKAALALCRSLKRAEELVHAGETDANKIREEMRQVLAAEPRIRVEYATVVDPTRLKMAERVTAGCVALVAAQVGTARLIDNLILGPPGTTPELLLQLALSAAPVLDARARIPGLETETLRKKIESCRDCAAITSILLPPREFLVKHLKREYPDLNAVRVAVIGRDSPINPENLLYRNPDITNRFVSSLFELLGVKNFAEFKERFVLTDALRCHASGSRILFKALEHCARHLREELKLFPNLGSIVVLGNDAYVQFQRLILGRSERELKPFLQLLGNQGWATEEVSIPTLGDRTVHVFYCHHPTYEYKRSPSIAGKLV